MTYKEAKELAAFVDVHLDYKLLDKTIHVVHEDGSSMLFTNSCAVRLSDDWISVYTEHQGNHIFNLGDLNTVRVYKPILDNYLTAEDILKTLK